MPLNGIVHSIFLGVAVGALIAIAIHVKHIRHDIEAIRTYIVETK